MADTIPVFNIAEMTWSAHILLDFAGEDNPRRACNYGLTEKGIKAMQDAANTTLPHTYAWFVITDCNTSGEHIFRDLTLEEAN